MFGKDHTFSSSYNYIKFQKHLIYNRDIPQGSCLCEVCENACLLAKGINNSRNIHLPINPHDMVQKYACNSDSKLCMYENCDQCIINEFGDKELSDEESASNMVMYQNWCRQDKKGQKVSLTIDYEDAMEQWIEEISNLKKHILWKRIQAEEFNKRKEELEEGELIVQYDYSENYKNDEQDEIQRAYFGHTCFSIFTVCAFYKADDKLIKNPITIL